MDTYSKIKELEARIEALEARPARITVVGAGDGVTDDAPVIQAAIDIAAEKPKRKK